MSSAGVAERVKDIHRNAIVYDAVCPLAQKEATLDDLIKGGVNVVAPTIGGPGSLQETMASIGMWYERLRRRTDELLLVTRADDMQRARDEGKLGIIFHLQGTGPLGRDVGLVEVLYRLGVRIMQLTYNVKDFVGDGCEEPGDGGLSDFGRTVVQEMNRVGMVVDLSHTGHRTTMEAMEVSQAPCVFSHSNCEAVFKSNRNIDDDQVAAAAATGGVVGVTAFPGFISGTKPQPTKQDMLAHFDHLVEVAGVDHVGFGSDYFEGQDPYVTGEEANRVYRTWIDSGAWKVETYSPPPYIYPEGIETPDRLENLTRMLVEHEFSDEDVGKILGGNFMRVYGEVWK